MPEVPPVITATLLSSFFIVSPIRIPRLTKPGAKVSRAGGNEKDFVWLRHASEVWLAKYGAPAPTLLRRRGRGGQPHGGSRKATFCRTAFAEPPNSWSRTGSGCGPSHSRSPRSGPHGGGPSVSRSCADRAAASRGGLGGGPPRAPGDHRKPRSSSD